MNTTIAWEKTIRTGHPVHDEQEAAACRAHAAGQGLLFEQFAMPQGGVHVRASIPAGPPGVMPYGAPAQPMPQPMPMPQYPQQQPMPQYPQQQPMPQPIQYAVQAPMPQQQPMQYPMQAPMNAPLAATRCQGCGSHAETKSIVLVQNIGVVVLRFQKVLRGHYCKTCIRRHFWKMTTIMFFFGWWGVVSFIFTVIGIPTNCVQYIRTLSMKDSPAR